MAAKLELVVNTTVRTHGIAVADLARQGVCLAQGGPAHLLDAIGATEGIAESRFAYIEAAVSFGTNMMAYERYTSRFGNAVWRETFGDIVRFTTDYEAALISLQAGVTGVESGAAA